jgi:hypothetical protein
MDLCLGGQAALILLKLADSEFILIALVVQKWTPS